MKSKKLGLELTEDSAAQKTFGDWRKEINGTQSSNMTIIDEAVGQLQEDVQTLNDGGLVLKDTVIDSSVKSWLTAHPEATTTVQDGSITADKLAPAVKQSVDDVPGLKQDFTSLIDSVYSLSLGYEDDGLLYIHMNGIPIGDGVEVGDRPEPFYAFVADWESGSPKATQFYAWEGRDFDNAIVDPMSNIRCENGTMILKSKYDASRQRWIKQMVTTGGIFESDDFTLTYKAKFDGTAGSWQGIITYGTGTHWTSGTYSDGVKWPAGGEIDAFEQAGGYSDTPNSFRPCVHFGAGTNSGYPNTHERDFALPDFSLLPVNEWADFKFALHDGVYSIYVNNKLIASHDVSEKTVSNNYLWNYRPFIKPQAFYIDGACASSNSKTDKNHEFVFEVKDFKIMQKENVSCTALEIFPQMWERGTNLVFPVGAEIYLDRIYTPANVSNKACEWESSDPSVATVVQGYVSVKKIGNTTITARCGSASAFYNLVCSANASVPCAGIYVENIGTITYDTQLVYKLYPNFTTDTVSIRSNNEDVFTVDGTTIKPVNNGEATATIICGNVSKEFPVEVTGLSDTIDPYIAYDFAEGAEDLEQVYLSWDSTPKQIALTSVGTNDEAGVYINVKSSSGYMIPQILCQTEKDLIANNDTFAMFVGNLNAYRSNMGPTINIRGTDVANHAPSITNVTNGIEARFGRSTPYLFDTIPNYIVIGHDRNGYYLYSSDDGIINSNSGTGYLGSVKGISSGGIAQVKTRDDLNRVKDILTNMQIAIFKADRTQIAKMAKYFGY